tara:strand:- start:239 stop:1162 length:924 start_codon:yes stop_codon:yes gene_type:complete
MKIIIIYLILIFYNNLAFGIDILIKAKLDNEIITNIDIDHEKKYLMFLNPKLEELENKKIEEIAKNSLITELVKEKELKGLFNFEKNTKIIDVLQETFIKKKKIKNKKEFLEILKRKELDYQTIRNKFQIEGLWNQLIYKKYFKNVKINKKNLRLKITNSIKNKKEKYEFNLSEIVFRENSNESFENLINKINNSIASIGFENSANIFSISNSAKNGGLIGWVNELQISDRINKNLKNLKINNYTMPIKISSGYIIIKINDKRVFEEKINIEDQLNNLISQETNRQLNSFSTIFYKRLKKNLNIYEY